MGLRIIVAGGGIGGLASALALARRGHRVQVLEQASAFAEVGAGIQLGPNATRRLKAFGLGKALDDVAARPDALVVRGAASDREIARLPLGDAMLRRYGAPYCCVHRADLQAVLLDAVRASDRVVLDLDARIARIEARDDAVRAAAADARAWNGDALVGADGLWSVARTGIAKLDPAPHDTGHTAWRGLLAQADLPVALRGAGVRVWLGARVHAVAYPVRRGEALNVVVLAESAPAGDARDWNQSTSLGALQHATGRCGGTLQALLEAVPGWRAWTLSDRPPLGGPAGMAKGRIALVGDAAHPMLPYMAQGAGMAIEDAAALGDALATANTSAGTSDGVPAALERYAKDRWARNARVQARARRNGEIFHMAGPARLARDLALRMLRARLLDVPWLYGG